MCLILAIGVDAQTTYGCNNANACNFDDTTVYDVQLGCTFPGDACHDATIVGPTHLNEACECVATVYGCTDNMACNYNQSATKDHGGCIYDSANGNTNFGCWVCSQVIDPVLGNQVADGQGVLEDNDINDNGECDNLEIYGCTNASACNYHDHATHLSAFAGNNPCEIANTGCEICGQLDSEGRAFRYRTLQYDDNNDEVIISVGDTMYLDTMSTDWWDPATGLILDNIGVSHHPNYIVLINDEDEDNTCDPLEKSGCRNTTACNYDSDATDDAPDVYNEADGTWTKACIFPEECGLCVTEGGQQFAPPTSLSEPAHASASPTAYAATIPDGHCDCSGGQLDALGNCLPPGDNLFCAEDSVGLGHGICDALEVHGCMDETACNFVASAGVNVHRTEQCQYPGLCGCNNEGTANGTTKDLPDGACNCDGYTLDAIGNCLATDDPGRCTADVNTNSICDIDEVSGCIDPNACNWDPNAAISDGSCLTEDLCGVCGGSTTVLPAGWCNCEGDTLDAAGVCGGHCELDSDQDGLCDDIDPCPNDYNVDKDICGVCGGNGPVYDATTCGCYTKPTDPNEWCECLTDSDGYPKGKIKYPTPGYDCDGNCLSDEYDEFGNCIVASDKVQTSLPDSLVAANVSGNRFNIETNPQRMYRWMQNIQTLHERMSTHLDDGSLSGGSDTLTIDKAIINNGNLIVSGETDLGYLHVPDTDANSSENDSVSILTNLFVQGYARIKGTTFSDGGVNTTAIDLSGDMSIGGDLEVAGKVQMDSTLHILDSLSTETAFTIGAFNQIVMDSTGYIIADSVAIRRDLIVHDSLSVGGELVTLGSIDVNHSQVRINNDGDIVASRDITAGRDLIAANSLTVQGGSYFANNMEIGKPNSGSQAEVVANLDINGTLEVRKATSLNTLSLSGNFHQTSGTYKSDATKFHIGKNAEQIDNLLSPNSNARLNPAGSYQLYVDGSDASADHGIVVRLNKQQSSMATNFMTFMNADNVVGRIEGETISETTNDAGYQSGLVAAGWDMGMATFALGQTITEIIAAATGVGERVASMIAVVIPGAGLTDSDVAEGVNDGVWLVSDGLLIGQAIGKLAGAITNMVGAGTKLGLHIGAKHDGIGIVYASGSGDYAEWLEKENYRIDFLPGEIVGVKGGLLTYNTHNSDHNLVISTNPIVLGNMPTGGTDGHEKVAFMGQVPIRVVGKVSKGDYILPSGDNNGYGIAVSKNDILLEQIPEIVGVAWENGDDSYFNIVNSSVGVGKNGGKELVEIISRELSEMRQGILDELSIALIESSKGNRRKNNPSRKYRRNRNGDTLSKDFVAQNSNSLSKIEDTKTQPTNVQNYSAEVDLEDKINSAVDIALKENIPAILEELIEKESNVTKEDWIEASTEFNSQVDNAVNLIQSMKVENGKIPDISNLLLEYPIDSSPALESISAINVAILDAVLQPEFFSAEIQKSFQQANKQNPYLNLSSMYPPGSAAERALIEDTREKVFNVVSQAMPYGRKAINQLQKQ